MKSTAIAMLVLGASVWAQQPATPAPAGTRVQSVQMQQPAAQAGQPMAETNFVQRTDAPTESDMYCAGFISSQKVPETTFIAAGAESPDQTRYADRDVVFLRGSGFSEGSQYAIIRHLQDPNKYEIFNDQKRGIASLGEMYAELGRVKVFAVRGNIAIARVELSCDGFTLGDLAVPWAEKQTPTLRRAVMIDRWAPPNGKLTGKVMMARDFDVLVGTRKKVYLNVGADKGVKVGDYFRAYRTYKQTLESETAGLPAKATTREDLQKDPPEFKLANYGDLGRRILGEMVVLSVHPRTATAMVLGVLEPIEPGDSVEMEDEPPPLPPPPAPNGPTISCTAAPATVMSGDPSTITCQAASADDRPLTIAFTANRGRVAGNGNIARLDTRSAGTGTIGVRAVVTDDRNMSAEAITMVNVMVPAASPTASKITEVQFKRNSAYVDNTAKAILDDVALRAQRDPNSSLGVASYTETGEATRLGDQRSQNIAKYLSKDKGLDSGRIRTMPAKTGARKGDIWMVPAGAQMPPQ